MNRKRAISRRSFLGLAASAGALAALAACQQSTSQSPTAAPGATSKPAGAATTAPAAAERAAVQELTVVPAFFTGTIKGDMAPLDPARRGIWSFHSLLWTQLVAGDTAGNVYQAKCLAESWETSADGKTYTFHLRKNAKFSDGSPITSKDVVGTFGYYAMMCNAGSTGYRENFGTGKRLLSDIVGFVDAGTKATYDEHGTASCDGIKAPDDSTVQITLTAPSATFTKRLQSSIAIFQLKNLLAGKGAKFDQFDFWCAHAAASGPYKLSEVVPGDRYSLVPNENYFGPKPSLSKITCRFVSEDPNTRLTAFANGEFDMLAEAIQGDQARQALADPKLAPALVEIPTWNVIQFWMTPNVPLEDVHVRRAISMATDKDGLISLMNAGSAKPLFRRVTTHRNPGVPHCQNETAKVTPLPFDPAKAKAELALSKYGAAAVDIELHILSQTPSDLPQCEALQKMIQENLGWKKVTIHTEKVPDLTKPPFPLHLWYNSQQPWYADITDTLRNMAIYIRDKEWAAGDAHSFVDVAYEPELKKLIDDAMAENDPAKRCQLVQQACQLWNDHAFSMDFGVPVAYYLIRPWIKDIKWYENAGQGKPLNIEEVWVAKH